MSLSTCTWTHLEVTDHELVGGHVFESTLLGLAGGRTERHGDDDCAETLVSTAALTVPGGTSNGAVGRSPTSFGVGEGQLTIVGRLAEELGDVGRADNGIVSCADGHDVRVGCEGECEGGERGPTGSFYRQAEPRLNFLGSVWGSLLHLFVGRPCVDVHTLVHILCSCPRSLAFYLISYDFKFLLLNRQ